MDYITARKRLYIPGYEYLAIATPAWQTLLSLARESDVWLWDFDGYNSTMELAVEDESRPMGHAFVLAHHANRALQT